ncbi:MAG TPA: HYR domain-containing protein, partial [Pyrinomonadaceae bacterium]
AGNNFPVGTTTVTYRATDRSGNFADDTQVVTVVDNTPPAITCPGNITLEPTCPTGAIATYTAPVGTDNCPGATTQRTAGPASGSVFSIGTTTVTYSVTDAHNNGPVSCSFTVTVLTAQQVIQNLINAVNASSLTGTQKNGLLAKLNAALQGLQNGQTNVACNKLSEFNNSVGVLINNGSLSAATGNAWISSSNHVRNTIGCTNLPCS